MNSGSTTPWLPLADPRTPERGHEHGRRRSQATDESANALSTLECRVAAFFGEA